MRVNGALYYVLGNQLGSASVVLSASRTTIGETRYTPFGETRVPTSGNMHTDKLYTGQREMSGLGIYYYNARFYDAHLKRWTQLFMVL